MCVGSMNVRSMNILKNFGRNRIRSRNYTIENTKSYSVNKNFHLHVGPADLPCNPRTVLWVSSGVGRCGTGTLPVRGPTFWVRPVAPSPDSAGCSDPGTEGRGEDGCFRGWSEGEWTSPSRTRRQAS